MASRLYRLGRFAFRRRRLVLALWLALLVAMGVAASTLSKPYSNEFSIPGTESQQAIDVLGEKFPASGLEKASANVVFAAPEGQTLDTPESRTAVAAVLDRVRKDKEVTAVTDPFAPGGLAPGGGIAKATVTYSIEPLNVDADNQDSLFDSAEPGEAAGLEVEFSGSATMEQEGGAAELIGVGAAAIILLVMFGSFVAAGFTLLTALIGVGVGMAGITALTGFVELSSSAPILALMLGLAVGIDYALFITSRFRHELLSGRSGEESAGRAVATAGSAVVFAGLTVVIALVGMWVVNIPFLTVMGLGAAGTVVVAVCVALTLLPALLGFAGSKVLGRKGRAAPDPEAAPGGTVSASTRWATFVVRHKLPVLVVTLLGLIVVAIPAASLQTSFPDEGQLSESTTQRQAYDLLAEGFGAGSNGPLTVVVEGDSPAAASAALAPVEAVLRSLEGVASVAPATPNPAGDTYLFSVDPTTGPGDVETEAVVHRLRDAAPALEQQTGTQLSVTGSTALTVDVAEKLADALPIYLIVVIGLALVLLTIVFRSLLVPLKAALGFLLTVLTTFGAVVAVFQWGWFAGLLGVEQTGPILAFLPVFMIGVIFGLAMDYEVFLVTRIREEYVHGADAEDAIVEGVGHGGRVVTAAALIMISVFASFMLSPDATSKSLGFAFAFGIAVDAFLVRMTVVPAVLAFLGDRAWGLPRWLDRLVPRVDVEGAGLRVEDDEPEPVLTGV